MVEKANRRPSAGKVYYQISEVAQLTGVNESTLRNWEEQHEELRNIRRINNRRHYTAADIATIERISKKRSTKEIPVVDPETAIANNEQSSAVDSSPDGSAQKTLTTKQLSALVKELGEIRKELLEIAAQLA